MKPAVYLGNCSVGVLADNNRIPFTTRPGMAFPEQLDRIRSGLYDPETIAFFASEPTGKDLATSLENVRSASSYERERFDCCSVMKVGYGSDRVNA
jgi:hypothetical protein